MASSARIDELSKKFEENPRRYFAPLANEYRKAGDLERAVHICQEYLPQQPGHMSGHIVYGQALYELGKHEEARQVFETALSLDPENLIALRHLGDIARQMGDNKSARIWYQRVLEADPRNEEIAQIMMTLLATPDIQQVAVAPNTATPLSTPAVPASAPMVDSARATDPAGYRPVEPTGFQVEKSSDGSDLAVGPALTDLPQRQPTPAIPISAAEPLIPEWKRPIPEEELLDISDLSVGGVSLADLGTEPSIDEPPAAETSEAEEEFTESSSAFVASSSFEVERASEPVDAATPSFEASADDEFTIQKEEPALEADEPFEADPFAIAATPQIEEEHVADIVLGLPDDGTPAATFSGSGGDNVIGLETFEHGVTVPDAEAPSALAFESFFDQPADAWPVLEGDTEEIEIPEATTFEPTPVEQSAVVEPPTPVWSTPEPEPVFATPMTSSPVIPEPAPVFETPIASLVAVPEPERVFETPIAPVAAVPEPEPETVASSPTPAVSEPAQPEPAEAFVTETMAELYLQQGHLEPALEIYQKLVEQRPHDAELAGRMRVIEDALHGRSSRAAEVEPEPPAAAYTPPSAGPTIRDFLVSLVGSHTPSPTDLAVDVPADSGETWSDVPAESAERWSDVSVPVAESELTIDPEPASIDEDFGPPETAPPSDVVFDPHETPISSPSLTPRSTRPVTPLMSAAITPISTPAVTPLSNARVTPVSSMATPIVSPAVEAPRPSTPPRSATPVSTMATPIVSPAVEQSRMSTPVEPRRTATRGLTPAVARETVSGSIDALFSGADASSKDANAANTLAQAFAPEGPETKPLQGMPAHKASSELSLDHVFKTGQAPRAEGDSDGFSFDQFFSDDLGDGAPKGQGEAPVAPKQGPDDIAQFNAWLNGLKKT